MPGPGWSSANTSSLSAVFRKTTGEMLVSWAPSGLPNGLVYWGHGGPRLLEKIMLRDCFWLAFRSSFALDPSCRELTLECVKVDELSSLLLAFWAG